jgi:hypothetical protein
VAVKKVIGPVDVEPVKRRGRKPGKYQPGWMGETRGGYAPGLARPGSVKNYGTYTAEDCPREGCKGKIVYSGNYFCEYWGYVPEGEELPEGTCEWALPHPPTEYQDRLVSWNLTREWECELPNSMHRHITKPLPGEVCMIKRPVNGGIVKTREHLKIVGGKK